MTTAPQDARKRLGELLVQRRIELNPRWRKRTVFAEDHGLNWRLLYDIERAKRDSFSDETLAAVEVAYRWRPGSIAKVLVGGEPILIDDHASPDDDLDALERDLGLDLSTVNPDLRRAVLRRYQRFDERLTRLEREAEERRA